MGATCSGCTCEDEAADIGDDFYDDEPPRVACFDFCILSLDGVVDYFLDLFG